ncbi:MAG TPA: ABC transporter permease [Puia sp.]|nr:ABC transporter permease [Puia sp.]
MNRSFSEIKAVLILSKYSLVATLRSPTSVVFSLLFPIIFIVVFGSMVGGQMPVMKVAVGAGCDTMNLLYKAIGKIPAITLKKGMTAADQSDALRKGRLTAVLMIKPDVPVAMAIIPHYSVRLEEMGSSPGAGLLETLLREAVSGIDRQVFPGNPSIARLTITHQPGRVYKQIDFILPGQLGFSLLMAGVFGSSFLLFSLRQSLVLKRLRATPVRRRSIIAGEMLSRLFFHVIGFMIMVLLGYYVFGFTLVNGGWTFVEMLAFSFCGLGIFMGIGFVISGVIQNESSISPVANTVVLPQILLCGLFFPIESYPHWLQGFCNLLPLTLFVDGLRQIAFEGVHMWQMPVKIAGLVLWTVLTGVWAVRAFKWE